MNSLLLYIVFLFYVQPVSGQSNPTSSTRLNPLKPKAQTPDLSCCASVMLVKDPVMETPALHPLPISIIPVLFKEEEENQMPGHTYHNKAYLLR